MCFRYNVLLATFKRVFMGNWVLCFKGYDVDYVVQCARLKRDEETFK